MIRIADTTECCKVTEVLVDNLDSQTGRPLDAYSYTLQAAESGDELPIRFAIKIWFRKSSSGNA